LVDAPPAVTLVGAAEHWALPAGRPAALKKPARLAAREVPEARRRAAAARAALPASLASAAPPGAAVQPAAMARLRVAAAGPAALRLRDAVGGPASKASRAAQSAESSARRDGQADVPSVAPSAEKSRPVMEHSGRRVPRPAVTGP
jgi:hypothetical protein